MVHARIRREETQVERKPDKSNFLNVDALGGGLTWEMVCNGIEFVYDTLDKLDATLVESESPRMAGLVELANLSSMLGNMLATGIVHASDGVFERAGPHKYQDLRAAATGAKNIEIKVSLEKNKPKGHLPKTGRYLCCRYVLGDADGNYTLGERGNVVWIWEVRFGFLKKRHFNLSNTEGDSGKTAVVNADGMAALSVVFFDATKCPYSPKSPTRRQLTSALRANGLRL